MNKVILVTGGAGYIGSHTCKLLHQMGYSPVVLDNLVYGHESFVKWGPFIDGDIRDQELLDVVFKQYSPAAVIHFAAFAYVGESMAEPERYYHNNVCGTLSLLGAMRRNACNHIVFSSSCATYGLPDSLPIGETHEQTPINPYGRSKLMVEEILRDYDQAYGVKSVMLRYFNAAGADSEGEVGEDHTPETHLIPLTIYAALGLKPHVCVFGTDYDTADGTAIRDYVHVTDLAEAHVQSLQYLEDKGRSQEINLGTGMGCSVMDILKEVQQLSAEQFRVIFKERRKGDPPKLVADTTKAEQLLGWQPIRSDLKNIISTAWNWHACRHGRSYLTT